MLVVYGMRSGADSIAITISSSAALPARSPMPLIVHSTCRAPPCTAASELATASPRSSWQCALKIDLVGIAARARGSSEELAGLVRRRSSPPCPAG